MTADEILQQCLTTLAQRGKQYDPGNKHERSAVDAALIFDEVFSADGDSRVSPKLIWSVLICVKLARLRTATAPAVVQDNVIDLINYLALLGEELTATTSSPTT